MCMQGLGLTSQLETAWWTLADANVGSVTARIAVTTVSCQGMQLSQQQARMA